MSARSLLFELLGLSASRWSGCSSNNDLEQLKICFMTSQLRYVENRTHILVLGDWNQVIATRLQVALRFVTYLRNWVATLAKYFSNCYLLQKNMLSGSPKHSCDQVICVGLATQAELCRKSNFHRTWVISGFGTAFFDD